MRGFTSYQIRVLAILTLINFVNYVDRQIIYPLFPLIEADFHLTYSQLGLLAVAFSVVHSVGTLPFGRLADRVSKKKVISYAVLFWSGATFLSGLATSFRSLLTARALVGVGEAAYTPAGTALITASFPRAIRARVQGVFDVGMFIGGAVGIGLGAILAELWGWRTAFFVVGVPGLLLALSIVRLPEVASPPQEKPVPFR
ncbi:MAG: MFS transporter, partial [Acidobacteria bacterium]|nr:MFS transporter [Acidobacteriota bacterium]